jgi:hypothetical protein
MVTRIALLALLLSLAGCVEFVEQTILVRYDKATDTIRGRLIYVGLYAGGDEDKDVAEALEQLQEAAETKTQFYVLDNWPLGADLAPPKEGKKDSPGNALLRPYTTLRNGTFFLDPQGRLCAWQDIEIKDATKFLAAANRFFTAAVLIGEADVYKDASPDTTDRLRKALAKGHEWVTLDESGLHASLPVAAEDAVRLKRGLLDEIVRLAQKRLERRNAQNEGAAEPDDEAPNDALETLLRVLTANRLAFGHDETGLRATLQPDASGMLRLDWYNKGRYVPNLVQPKEQGAARPKLPLPIDPKTTPGRLVEEFAAARPKD